VSEIKFVLCFKIGKHICSFSEIRNMPKYSQTIWSIITCLAASVLSRGVG